MGKKKEENDVDPIGKRPTIPPLVRLKLWVRAGGRCQYRGCNKRLDIDEIKQEDINISYMAHIYGFAKKSARYDAVLSPKLAKDFSNLMLMCDACHRRIDGKEKLLHPAELLIEMKKEHEERVINLTSIKENVKTHVIFYSARIGTFEPNIDFDSIKKILAEKFLYPTGDAIQLGIKNSPVEDNRELYWQYEEKLLEENFNKKVLNHFKETGINHFSLFALAPQPLLIKLGTLLPDLYTVDVYQKHREPDTWQWQEESKEKGFLIEKPDNMKGIPILNISLSAMIDNSRIISLFDENCSIWTLTIDKPNNNFLTNSKTLINYRNTLRVLFNEIKKEHGHNTVLNVFPCMPNSAGIELGRVWMPKADLSMNIYDERDGFKKAITINRK